MGEFKKVMREFRYLDKYGVYCHVCESVGELYVEMWTENGQSEGIKSPTVIRLQVDKDDVEKFAKSIKEIVDGCKHEWF